MSFLSKHLGIRFDSHTLPNLFKNASPALAFTPVGLAGTAIASAAGDLGRGKSLGDAAVGAAKNTALAAGARGGIGALRSALHSGSAPVAGGIGSAAPSAGPGYASAPLDFSPAAPTANVAAPSGFASGLRSGAGKLASFIHDNPTASGAALQSVGNIATAGPRNRIDNAQADLLEKQANETEYDFMRRKQRDAQLAPTYSGLGSVLGQSIARGYSPSPYTAGA